MVLEIVLADHAGFCFGVKRATEMVIELAKDSNKHLYTLGPLIHNPQVVQRLGEMGVKTIDDYSTIKEGIVVIRSHGVPPQVIKDITAQGLEVVDATCPFVKRAQGHAKRLAEDGYQVLICGDQDHPEVIGIVGSANSNALVVKTADELNHDKVKDKVGVIAQTTLSIQNFKDVIAKVLELAKEIKIHNTICTTTEKKQKATFDLAKKVDLMLVIGGRNSANTNRLVEICHTTGVKTLHIETASELERDWFHEAQLIGVTAGASTPTWIIKEVLDVMNEFAEEKKEVLTEEVSQEVSQEVSGEVSREVSEEVSKEEIPNEQVSTDEISLEESSGEVSKEVSKEVSEEVSEEVSKEVSSEKDAEEVSSNDVSTENQNDQEMMLDHSIRQLKKGDRIKGTVVQVKDDCVYVNINYKSDGIITLAELAANPVKSAQEIVTEGEEIEVVVLSMEDEEGNIHLSRKRVAREQAWEKILAAYENNQIVEAEVSRVVKGGLVVDIGLRGFVPASHVAIEYVENLEQFVGQKLSLKVIEIDRANNNVVLSRKVVLEEEREAAKAETIAKLEEGQIAEGLVTKIVDFGAFIDLGGIEGLLHISEMSWGRIDHPTEVLQEGEKTTVKVLKLDLEKERIALGLKQILPDPWVEFIDNHSVGEVVNGTITKTVDFGAFMEVAPGIEGLIHISQLARRHVEKTTEVVSVGDQVDAKIININEADRKIGLSMKELEPAPTPKPKPEKSTAKKANETYSTAPQETSGFSIGEMIGDIFENKK